MSQMKMSLFNGRRCDPNNVTFDDVALENIAHSLSLLCRFGGHSREFYSVAQHSVRVMELVPPSQKLEALLHDATESFVQDLIRPVKRMFPQYKQLECEIWRVIALKYGLPIDLSAVVLHADNVLLKSEIAQFVTNPEVELADPFWLEYPDTLPPVRAWSPNESKAFFLMAFAQAVAFRSEYLATNPTVKH